MRGLLPAGLIASFLRLLSAALLLAVATAHVAAEESRSKNYYGVVTAKSQSVCQTVLASLNKEYSFSAEQLSVQTNPHLVGDFLLMADIQVQWRRNNISHGTDAIDHSEVDLRGTGEGNIVYRLVGGYMHNRGNDLLFASDHLARELSSDDPVSASALEIILREANVIAPSFRTTPEWKRKRDAPRDDVFYYNIVEVSGRGYVLAAPSYPADQRVFANAPMSIDVYVLEYGSPKQLPMICHFHHLPAKKGAAGKHR